MRYIVAIFIACCVAYLVSSFVQYNINAGSWTTDQRFGAVVMAIIGSIIGCGCVGSLACNEELKRK